MQHTSCALQVQQHASVVRDMVMLLVSRKLAGQHLWLHLLFHTIPAMEASQPTAFSVQDTQQLLSRVQVGCNAACGSTSHA